MRHPGAWLGGQLEWTDGVGTCPLGPQFFPQRSVGLCNPSYSSPQMDQNWPGPGPWALWEAHLPLLSQCSESSSYCILAFWLRSSATSILIRVL
jgi:hypothetical protein